MSKSKLSILVAPQNTPQVLQRQIAAAHNQDDLFTGQPCFELQGCRQGNSARAFGQVVRVFEQEHHGCLNILVVNQDKIIQVLG